MDKDSCWTRANRCPVMAHDSNFDSWDFRQGDSSSHNFYQNLPRSSTIFTYNGESDHHPPSNGYSRCQHRTRSTGSGSDSRFANPSIHSESRESKEEFRRRPIIEANCGDSSTLVGNISSLSISGVSNAPDNAGDQQTGRNTYRCLPLSPTTASSIVSSRGNSKSSVTVRCCTIGKGREEESNEFSDQPEVQRYAVNGQRVVEFSASSSNLSERQGSSTARRNAYEEWVEKKKAAELRRKEEARRIEQEKQAEEERLTKEREERERRERENFLQWAERKRKEEASRKEAIERELEFERRLKEVEDKAVVAKTLHLRQWARKKEEQQKALQRKQELKQKREDEERKMRLELSSKAYEKWRETSKNRPRPATQGLLPHQKATPSYINPNPWIVDDNDATEVPKSQSSVDAKKSSIGQSRSSVRKSIASKQ